MDEHSRRAAHEAASLSLNVRGLKSSATIRVNELSKRLQAEGHDIIKLGLGQSPFPVPEPVRAALAANAHQKDYLPVQGLLGLREAVARYHREIDGATVEAQDVLIGPGSKELMFLLQVAFYGDLLVPSPCWVSYGPQARIIGRPVRVLPTSYSQGWRLSPERLNALCEAEGQRPRVLILNYPGNPDGLSYRNEELEQLAHVARAHDVILLSDEIYGELHHRGEHTSVSRYYPEGTIISNGLSKWCGAGGWRLGTFAFPRRLAWLRQAMEAVASETYTSVCAPVQYAAVVAFEREQGIQDYLRRCRTILRNLGAYAVKTLSAAKVRVKAPTGGFYLFLDFSPVRRQLHRRGIRSGADLCEELLEDTGVAILPGEAFERPAQELSARLAYVDFEGTEALKALEAQGDPEELTEAQLTQWCGPSVEGIRRIAAWLATS